MEVHFSTVDSEGQSHGLSVGQSDMKSEGQSDVKFSATLAWIDVALDKPVVFRLDKNVFRIASSAVSPLEPEIVVSSIDWQVLPKTGYNEILYGGVTLRRQPDGKFKAFLESAHSFMIFEYYGGTPIGNGNLKGRQFDGKIIDLQDGDIFTFGVDDHNWTSVGDSGLAKFQIHYENEPRQRKIFGAVDGLEDSPFKKLPTEVIAKIFDNIPMDDYISNIPAVCQRFFDVSKLKLKKENLDLCFAGNTSFDERPFYYACEAGLLAKIMRVSLVKQLRVHVRDYVGEQFIKNLTSLIGPNCAKVNFKYDNVSEIDLEDSLWSTECFKNILEKLSTRSKVKTLTYSWSSIDNGLDGREDWAVVNCLEMLSLEFNSFNDFIKASKIFHTFPNLKSFVFNDEIENSSVGLFHEVGASNVSQNTLRTLKVENFPQFVAWSSLKHLEALELVTSFTADDDDFFTSCVTCFENVSRSLRHLKVVLPNTFVEVTFMECLTKLPRTIATIVLHFSVMQVNDVLEALRTIAGRCPRLETVGLMSFGRVSINEFQVLFELLPQLKELVVEETGLNSNVSVSRGNDGLYSLNRNVSTLRDLDDLFVPFEL